MAAEEYSPPRTAGRRRREDALHLGPRKKAYNLLSWLTSLISVWLLWQVHIRSTHIPWPSFWQDNSCAMQCPNAPHQRSSSYGWAGRSAGWVLYGWVHDYLGHIAIALTSSPSRERREHRVFEALIQAVPGLQEQLLEGGEDDVVVIAEMVCLLLIRTVMLIFTATGVTKRCIKCSIWWHQRFERSRPGLDYASGSITQPTSCS